MNGSFGAENALAFPLVTGNGGIAITWTAAVNNNARVGVKAAWLTSTGLRAAQVVSRDAANAAVGDAAVGPSGQAAIVWSQFDTQTRAPRTPRCRPVRACRSARPTCSPPPKRPASAAQP